MTSWRPQEAGVGDPVGRQVPGGWRNGSGAGGVMTTAVRPPRRPRPASVRPGRPNARRHPHGQPEPVASRRPGGRLPAGAGVGGPVPPA
ncbi:MAG: hypothetical protein U0871_10475 [Gemmataceae bacterium]